MTEALKLENTPAEPASDAKPRIPLMLWASAGLAACVPGVLFAVVHHGWHSHAGWSGTLVLGGIAVGMLLNYVGRTARIEQLVVKRTGELREHEHYVSTILESVQTAIVVIEADTQTIVQVNRAAETMIGVSKDEILGKQCHNYICPAERGKCPIINLSQTVDNSERVLLTADGRRISVLKTVAPVTLNGRRLLLESFVDISDRKRSEETLRNQRDLGVALNAASELDEVLRIGLETILKAPGIDAAGIYLSDGNGGLELRAHGGASREFVEAVSRIGADSPLIRWVSQNKPGYSPEARIESGLDALARREGLVSWGVLPVHRENCLVACVMVASRVGATLPDWVRHAIEGYVSHAGTTIGRLLAEKKTRETQSNLQSLFDSIDEFAFVIDSTGNILQANRLVESRLGYSAEQLKGMTLFDLHPPERHDEVKRLLAAMRTLNKAASSLPLLTKDGEAIQVESRFTRSRWGNRDAYCGISRDMTERIRSEHAIRSAHAQLHQIFNAAVPLCVIDVHNRMLQVNDAFCVDFGVKREEVLGKTCQEAVPCAACQAEECPLRHIQEGRERFAWEADKLLPDGRMVACLMTATPFRSPDGDLLGAVVGFIDMTQQKQAESALESACHEAKAANEAKSLFLANMSHELRTPLHGILSFAAFGQKKAATASPETLREYFELIQQSGDTLLSLVNDLLDLSRLEAGKTRLSRERVDLHSLVVQTVDEFQSMLSARNLAIECAKPEGDVVVVADDERIRQVIRNLLSNAIKYSTDDGRIEIALRRRCGSIVFSIRDHGIGIPEAERESVFDKFIQSSKTHTGAGGAGLGLALCREIVAAHGGRIWAECPADGGALLMVELPVEQKSGITAAPPASFPWPSDIHASTHAGRE